jgi:hypothetical protein
MELLSKAVTVAMLTFVVSSMLAMGAALTVSQIFDPLPCTSFRSANRITSLATCSTFGGGTSALSGKNLFETIPKPVFRLIGAEDFGDRPRLSALPVAVNDGQQFLATVLKGPD